MEEDRDGLPHALEDGAVVDADGLSQTVGVVPGHDMCDAVTNLGVKCR